MKEREASCTIKVYEVLFQNGEGLSGSNENSRGNKLKKGKEREEKIMNGLSKRLVSLTMATAMVFSLAAVPATDAEAASKYSIKQRSSVQATKYYDYALKGVAKTQYAKVSVSGTAKSGVTVKNGSTKITSSKKIKGTGKTLTLKVKANSSVVGKKYTLTTKIYNTKTNKKVKTLTVKNVMVNYSAKSVKLDQTAVELEVGKTATLKATMSPAKTNSKISWKTSDPAVATVENGVVTAVSAGTAAITVKTSSGKTATATVTVKEAGKKDEVLQMTAVKPAKADTVEVTFASATSTNTAITVRKVGTTKDIDGKVTWNADNTVATFVADARFTTGDYTVTAKLGEQSQELPVAFTTQKVSEIKITSKTALTNDDKTKAYVYYKVLDQYGEDITESTSVEVSSSAKNNTLKKSEGKIELSNGNAPTDAFRYNDLVTVNIIHTATGTIGQSNDLRIGLEQNPDKIEVMGFLNQNFPTKIEEKLPADFTKNTWIVLFRAFDQDGNMMDAKENRVGDSLTVTCTSPLLVDSTFATAGKIYTIGGKDYEGFKINPGMNVDKGGVASLSVISGKTGTTTPVTVEIGATGILKSFVLGDPGTVCDGEQNIEIPFTATLTDGTTTTDYETIVRSSNKLTLNSTVGTLKIAENNDGTAKVTWSDGSLTSVNTMDGVARPVTFTTVVIGGESSNETIQVQDQRRPVAVKSIKYDAAMVISGNQSIDFAAGDNVEYVDQYGKKMHSTDAYKWFKDFAVKDTKNDYKMLIEAKTPAMTVSSNTYKISVSTNVQHYMWDPKDADNKFELTATKAASGNLEQAAQDNSLKVSIISIKDSATDTEKEDYSKWTNVDKVYSAQITTVSLKDVKGAYIEDLGVFAVSSNYSKYANGAEAGLEAKAASMNSIDLVPRYTKSVTVKGFYNGNTVVTIPTVYLEDNSGTLGYVNGAVVTANSISGNKLYDTNTATLARKNATMNLKLTLKGVSGNDLNGTSSNVIKNVTVNDGAPVPTTMKLLDKNGKEIDKATFTAVSLNTVLGVSNNNIHLIQNKDYAKNCVVNVVIYDQFGDVYNADDAKVSYTVSDLKENAGQFAHKDNSLAVQKNATNRVDVVGTELGDTYVITVEYEGLSKKITITQGADGEAYITNDDDSDKDFRKLLGYDR